MVNKGIKQGDSLSVLLFIVVMDKIIKNLKEKMGETITIIRYKNLEPAQINSLTYADDIVIIADTQKKIQRLVNIWGKRDRGNENGSKY